MKMRKLRKRKYAQMLHSQVDYMVYITKLGESLLAWIDEVWDTMDLEIENENSTSQ